MECGDAGYILLSSAAAENLLQVRAWADAEQDFGEAEVKYGVRVHVYNLCKECMDNAELPQKLQAARQSAKPRIRTTWLPSFGNHCRNARGDCRRLLL